MNRDEPFQGRKDKEDKKQSIDAERKKRNGSDGGGLTMKCFMAARDDKNERRNEIREENQHELMAKPDKAFLARTGNA